MRGKDLVKMNQKAFDDYNDTALMSCPWCSRSDTLYGLLSIIYVQGVPQLSSHFVLVVCCASHASPIIKWSIYFFLWIKIYANQLEKLEAAKAA